MHDDGPELLHNDDQRPAPAGTPPQSIDIVQLAAKVYRLMQRDLRLERARGARVALRLRKE